MLRAARAAGSGADPGACLTPFPPLTVNPHRLSHDHVLLGCVTVEPMTLTEVQRQALKTYPMLTWLGKPGELPDAVRWRWRELTEKDYVRAQRHHTNFCFVLTPSGDSHLSDLFRREVIEPHLQGLLRAFGPADTKAHVLTLSAHLQRVATSLWPALMS